MGTRNPKVEAYIDKAADFVERGGGLGLGASCHGRADLRLKTWD